MSSNINPYSIDGTFPVQGQDNSSQGFRDNFTNIKNNFISAQAEISDLQTKAIVTSALTGQTLYNDMAGTQIRRPQLAAWTQSFLPLGAVTGDVSLDFTQANFQYLTTADSINLTFINWPASVGQGAVGYGLMRVWIYVSNTAHTVTLPENVNIAVEDIAGYDGATRTIRFDAAGNYVFDISSVDSGTNFLIFDVTRNRASFRDSALYYNPDVVNTFLIGFGPAVQAALAFEQGIDTISTLGSYNSVTVGNLGLASPGYQFVDTGGLGGYAVTAARGNAAELSIEPVQSNDILGYFNAIAYTGNTTQDANTFGILSTITFHATGANVAGGLGGNVAVFTTRDGYPDALVQTIGFENDQSVQVFGNLITGNTYVPSTSSAGGTKGQISYDADYMYICLDSGNWKRIALSSF